MSDKHDDEFTRLGRRLADLPREIPPSADTWKGIERAIVNAPLDERLRGVAQSVQPAQDLWPGIAAQIRNDRLAPRSNRLPRRAAAAVLAAGLAIVVIGGLALQGYLGPAVRLPLAQGPQGLAASGDEFVSGSEPDPATALLFSSSARPELSEAQAVYETHIALVREQRKAIEASLAEYPNDLSLRALWRHAYETELFLIDAAGRTLSSI